MPYKDITKQRQAQKEHARRKTAKALRDGHCLNCYRPRKEGSMKCQTCLDAHEKSRKKYPIKYRKYNNDMRTKYYNEKRCPNCGRPKLDDNETKSCMVCRHGRQRGGIWN